MAVGSKCSFLKEGVVLRPKLQMDFELRVSEFPKKSDRKVTKKTSDGKREGSPIFRLT